MMLVMEVVTTALLLVAIAAAQKPTTIDESSVNTKQQVREASRFLHRSLALAKRLPDNQTKEIHDYISLKEYLDSEVALPSNEYIEGIDNSDKERMKRKVIFGGGSYGHGGRRTSAAAGGDPYGRRRGHYGPDNGPHGSGPYRQPDIPYVDTPMHGTSGSYGSQIKGVSTQVYSTARPTPTNSGFHPSRSSDIYDRQSSSVGNGRKTKTGVHETPKTKLAKDLKWEIAKFAVQHGTRQAAIKFEDIVGRKLPLRKVEKFIKRYQKQQKKNKGYNR